MKITTITHKPPKTKKPALNFLKSKQDHPHTIEREYMRSLNSVKLDKLFAKPFIKQYSLNEGVTFIQMNPEKHTELLALTYSNEVSIIDMRLNKIKTLKISEHVKTIGFYTMENNETRIFVVTMNDIHILKTDLFVEEQNDNRKFVLKNLPKPISLIKRSSFNFIIRSAHFCKYTNKLYLATDKGLVVYKDGTYETIFNKEVEKIKVSKEVIATSFNNIIYLIDSISYLFLRSYELSVINDIHISLKKVSVACEDCSVYLINLIEMDKPPRLFLGHIQSVTACHLSVTNNILVTGSFDKSIRIFDIQTKKCEILYSERMSEINTILYCNTQEIIISGSNDGSVRIWKLPNKKMGLLNKKQQSDLKHRKLLVEKFAAVKEIAVIERSRNIPRELKAGLKNKYEQRKAQERRDARANDKQ
ncbi:DDB1- and CUL4-associated factor 13 [Cucumispora dikerogammari]|nr:DDB1- and CUL4-associated factor 13 [Cucumispora dikerogammari]